MTKVRLALLWHMHQPLYRDPVGGAFLLPWVRLHAMRAYNDMAAVLERNPAVRCTVNFTPVLLEQIEAYARGEAVDRFLEVTRKPPADLDAEERQAVLRSFFMVDWETAIRPLPRYWELLQKRGRDVRYLDLPRVAGSFTDEEIGDLQLLFNLAWAGFAALEEEGLAALVKKGRHFTRGDVELVLAAQQRILKNVVPRWRRLAERGQVELSTTPYYHPILPLVCDSDAARRALPTFPLPPRFAWPDDARWHVREAIAAHARHFGAPPAGMWPAEGSVSPEAVEVLASEGVRWAATDEGILFRSLPAQADRLSSLYRPWRVSAGGSGELSMLFRDRGLSDLIGFTYARTGAREAVADFLSHLETIGAAWEKAGHAGTPTVGVFLDGENAWEHYPGSGKDFLEGLHRALAARGDVETVTLSEAVAGVDGAPIATIHSGSWIESSYRIWMGHEEDRRAWAALGHAREALARAERAGGHAPEALDRARRLLHGAEGSDWFWWYGDDFQTELALEFDGLFRSLVARACETLGAPLPVEILEPIKRVGLPAAAEGPVREPTVLVTPSIDGHQTTYFEWQGAGLYRPVQTRGSMFGAAQAFGAIHYGFDLSALYLRLDPAESPQRTGELCSGLRVAVRTSGREVKVTFPLVADGVPQGGRAASGPVGTACFARILEIALPFAELGLAPGTRVAVAVRVLRGEVGLDRLPAQGHLSFTVPDADFERIHWRV